MAALEKIRKKAVFLTIVIGVALLAFILGDAERVISSVFGNNNTIAKVDGEKISAVEFQKRYEEANQQLQNQGQQADAALVQQQVMEQIISERLLDKELDKVGIEISDAEITESMTGENANYMVAQFAQQMGVQSPAQLHDLLFNPGKYGATAEQVAEAKAQWNNIKDEVVKNLKYAKLQTLIAGAIQSNKLDRQQINEENAVTSTINFVKESFSSLTGDQYKPTEAELKAQYDKTKSLYRLEEEVRKIHYIAVNVVPSKEDLDMAAAMVGETLDSLRKENGVDLVRNNSDLVINESSVRLSDIRVNDVKSFVETAAVGQVSEPRFENSTYTYSIIKLNGKSMQVDSVNVNVAAVQGDKAFQDSILNLLNGGKTIADLKNVQNVSGQENQWQVILNIADSVKTKLINAPAGYFVLDSNASSAFLCKVNEKKAPKNIYDVAEIVYTVYPSTKTTEGLNDKLQEYITTNNTAETFEANAVKAGYNCMASAITPSSAQIDAIENSRKSVQWLFESKVGKVSPIMDDNNDVLLVVALDAAYKDYAPLSDAEVNANVSLEATNEKKAAEILKKLDGKKTLSEFATAMNAKVDTAQVTFGQSYIPKIGAGESELTGAVYAAKENSVVGPIKGKTGVYAFVVTNNVKSERTPTDQEADRTFSTTRGSQAVMRNAVNILRHSVKVEKDMLRFF